MTDYSTDGAPAPFANLATLWQAFTISDRKLDWLATKVVNRIDLIDHRISWWRFQHALKRQHAINLAFDRRHGTDTAGEIHLEQTGVSRQAAATGNMVYRPGWEADFRAAIAWLPIDFQDFTFLDIGSGKGKLLLLASDFAFDRIVGVEYAPGLHEIAQANLARYSAPSQRCQRLQCVLGDALDYRLPEGPLVSYIFNAFEPSTMARVMKKIEADFTSRGTPAFLIYSNLRRVREVAKALDSTPHLIKIKAGRKLTVFGNAAAAALVRARSPRLSKASGLLASFTGSVDKLGWLRRKIANRIDAIDHQLTWRRFRRKLKRQHEINLAFDRRHGTDTAGEVDLSKTGLSAQDAERGHLVYRPVWEADFHAALGALGIEPSGYTFIDVGSGKGKLLMLASNYPFARIVGVEFSPGLHQIAEANLARYTSQRQRCSNFESVQGDALHYRLPDGALVCLLFSALDRDTMQAFLRRFDREAAARYEPVFLLFGSLRRVAEFKQSIPPLANLWLVKDDRKLMVFANTAAREAKERRAA